MACVSCGARFRVRGKLSSRATQNNIRTASLLTTQGVPPASSLTEETEETVWQVRKSDGTTLQFPSLALFRKWAVDGMVTVEDQISRNGKQWRYIVDIPELAGLLRQVEDNNKTTDGLLRLPDLSAQEYPLGGPTPVPTKKDEPNENADVPSVIAEKSIASETPPPPLPPPDDASQEISPEENISSSVPGDHSDGPAPNGDNVDLSAESSDNALEEAPPAGEDGQQAQADNEVSEAPPQITAIDERTEESDKPSEPEPTSESLTDLEPPADEFTGKETLASSDVDKNTELPAESSPQEETETQQENTAKEGVEGQEQAETQDEADGQAEAEVQEATASEPLEVTPPSTVGTEIEFSPPSTADEAGQPTKAESETSSQSTDKAEASTAQDMQLEAPIGSTTIDKEMEALGSTMEIPMGAAAATEDFDFSNALQSDSPKPGQWDPNAMTMPELSWGSDAEQPVPGAAEDPELNPDIHIQPVQALGSTAGTTANELAHDPPITSDETGGLTMSRPVRIIIGITMLALVATGAFFGAKVFLSKQTEPEATSPEQESMPEKPAPATAEKEKPAPPDDAPIVFLRIDPQPRQPETQRARQGIEFDSAPEILTKADKRKLAREEKSRASRIAALESRQAQASRTGSKTQNDKSISKLDGANDANDSPTAPKPAKTGPETFDELMAAARKAQKTRQYISAIGYLKRAALKNPKSVEPIAKLGWAYLAAGNPTQAILKFSEAKRKNPAYRDTYVGLGKSLERAGRRDDAIGVYKQYLRMCPNCRKAKGVRASLMRLGADL